MTLLSSWKPQYPIRTFGDADDGVIEIVTEATEGGFSEAGCYYGKQTHPHYPVFAVSVATGCRFRCVFCNTRLQPGRQLSVKDIMEQTRLIIHEAQERHVDVHSKEGIKINIGKTGEPLDNPLLPEAMQQLTTLKQPVRFKVASVFPAGRKAQTHFKKLSALASSLQQTIQMQISLISTDENFRRETAGPVASFQDIADAAALWRRGKPPREKWNLNLILAEETPCTAADIVNVLPPEHFQIRPRDCIATEEATKNNLTPISEERHTRICDDLRNAGYTVNLAGRPTSTEKTNRLAANATRYRSLNTIEPLKE